MFDESDIITSDKYLALDSQGVAYMKTDVFIMEVINWRGYTHTYRPAPVWISGHSDYGINQRIFSKYEKHTTKWFTVNKEYQDPKLIALPLGITNNTDESPIHRIYGNTQIMLDIMKQPRVIKNLAYMNFSIQNYPIERQACFDRFKDAPWVTKGQTVNTLEGRRAFLLDLRNHNFVLCPRGNGIDTHRLWETLYMGSIPVVIRHTAVNEFADLPILFIDDWSEVTQAFLESQYEKITSQTWNLEKLKIGYWIKRIQGESE